MKITRKSPLLFVLLLVIMIFVAFSTISVEGRRNHHKKSRAHKHQKQRKGGGNRNYAPGPEHVPSIAPAPAPSHASYPTYSNIFDVLSFGAKEDGVNDDSKALEAGWKAAYKVGWAIVRIPSGSKFLIKPITLQGPCMPHLVLQGC